MNDFATPAETLGSRASAPGSRAPAATQPPPTAAATQASATTAADWNALGVRHTLAGALDQAVAAYEQALRLWPDYPDANSNLGVVRMQLGFENAH